MDSTTEKLVAYAREFSPGRLAARGPRSRHRRPDRGFDRVRHRRTPRPRRPARDRIRAGDTQRRSGNGLRRRLQHARPNWRRSPTPAWCARYDWNDGMLAQGGGHPSDMIPAMLAAGETIHASGEQVLRASSWRTNCSARSATSRRLRDAAGTRARSWASRPRWPSARLFGLNEDQMANAVSLALVPHIPLRVNRTGLLSMWKGARRRRRCTAPCSRYGWPSTA